VVADGNGSLARDPSHQIENRQISTGTARLSNEREPAATRPELSIGNGYEAIDPERAATVREATNAWHGCIIYGIGQVDDLSEPAIAVAEAAMAGCIRAETNLEDRLFEAMRGSDDPREVRAVAHDMVAGFRERMRSYAIRMVLAKHREERGAAH